MSEHQVRGLLLTLSIDIARDWTKMLGVNACMLMAESNAFELGARAKHRRASAHRPDPTARNCSRKSRLARRVQVAYRDHTPLSFLTMGRIRKEKGGTTTHTEPKAGPSKPAKKKGGLKGHVAALGGDDGDVQMLSGVKDGMVVQGEVAGDVRVNLMDQHDTWLTHYRRTCRRTSRAS